MRKTMHGQEWLLIMDKKFDQYKTILDYLLEADKCIWNAVLEINELDDEQLGKFVQPLMQLRGEIHVDFMRPIYTKYPELAQLAGFDEEDET